METRFNPTLVTLSVVVAIFASYVALNLANSVSQAVGRARVLWLSAGALAMGIGIWSMHFIGMLAFEMPGMEMAYDVPLMVLSIVVAVGASALALYIISRPVVPVGSILSGGISMAAAIAGMHYIGMYSMRMAATIEWNIFLVVLSIVIALVASFGALLILIRLQDKAERFWEILLASSIMGVAISGMHYTGMYAAHFVHDNQPGIESSNLMVTSGLSVAVVLMPLFILGLALISSIVQRRWIIRAKRTSEILGRSEERFKLLIGAVKDYAIFMLDADGCITTWNAGAELINGYTDEEIIGKHVSILYTKEDVGSQTATHELKLARETGHFECEGERVRKDGSLYWASIVSVPLFDTDGKLTGYSKVTRDITQVKESQRRQREINEELEERVKVRTRALQEREHQLRTIADAAPVLIAQLDRYETFLFANEAFRRWFYETGDVVVGRTFKSVLGDARYELNEPFIKKALSGTVATYERVSTSGDTTAVLGITFVPEFDGNDVVTGFIVVASDITKHKAIQAELEKAKQAAEVANATKSAFLANMSHEIRTPLGVVLGFSELLLMDGMNAAERSSAAEVIRRNGHLLSNIINDILDLSKVEAGKLEVERVDVPFSEVMKEIGTILNLEAAEKGIELRVAAEGVIPSQIRTDPLRLRQVLVNIVGNAIKFTSRGSVNVGVKLAPGVDGTTKLAFVVKDTGEGIRPDGIDRLFTPFSQADVSTTRKFGGTGLGLVLSKRLATALGGDVYLAESELGKGSTFVITIDPGVTEQVLFQSNETSAVAGVVPLTALAPLATVSTKNSLSELRILVADDSPDNQALIRKILKVAGATVEVVSNGREAVEKALAGDFALILMDLQMPEMDGYEATLTLRRGGYTRPIIALTAHAMKEERQKSLQNGFDDHITKPIDHQALIKTLAAFPH